MKNLKKGILVMAFVLMGLTSAHAAAGFSLSMGTDDFYLSVGNYDYLPYAYDVAPGYPAPQINFYNVMSDYGTWVYVPTFGQVWRPYVDYAWRPYVYGHWIYTSYGPTWQGYEPWAWAGYHYGNWIWTERYGWVWIPGYDWHPGRVVWSRSYDTIGWMPSPPPGYDYSRGYLYYRGNVNQFTYDDPYFFDDDNRYYGGYYNQGYNDLYYNPSYTNISVNLWVFINSNHYGYNNYADYYLDRDYTRDVFTQRAVRINSKPIQRTQLERVVRTRINEVPVRVKEFDSGKRKVKMVVPEGEEENIRQNANKVVRNVIAPAFAEKQKSFVGMKSSNEKAVSRVFRQENKQPKIETVSQEVVINKAKESNKKRDEERTKVTRQEIEKVQKGVNENREKKDRESTNQGKPSTGGVAPVPPPSGQKVKEPKPSPNANPYDKPKNPYEKPSANQPGTKQPNPYEKPSSNQPGNKPNPPGKPSETNTKQDSATPYNPYGKPAKDSTPKANQPPDRDSQFEPGNKKKEVQPGEVTEEQLKKKTQTSGSTDEQVTTQTKETEEEANQKKKKAEEEAAKKKQADKKKKDQDKEKEKPPHRF